MYTLTEDIIGSTMVATSCCFSRRRGMPSSRAAAARKRTLLAEWTTRGITSLAQHMASAAIWDGACSSNLTFTTKSNLIYRAPPYVEHCKTALPRKRELWEVSTNLIMTLSDSCSMRIDGTSLVCMASRLFRISGVWNVKSKKKIAKKKKKTYNEAVKGC